MLSSIIRQNEKSAKLKKSDSFDSSIFEKKGEDGQFLVFHDYLGLINLVQPLGLISSFNFADLKAESMDYQPLFGINHNRVRMDSVDSDALSDSCSSGGSRSESDLMLENMNSSGSESHSYSSKPSSTENLSQTYAQTLESIIAGQKNVINRLTLNKDNRATKNTNKATVCVFCRNNGESQEFFRSHTLKDADGNTTCPILRAYTCPLCKENGDKSHTIKYCTKYTPKVKTDRLLGIPSL